MQVGALEVSASHAMSNHTLSVKVTGLQVMKARLWLGMRLLRLAAAVIGCKIEIECRGGEL